MNSKTTAMSFISGGGEMGELFRQKDWSQTIIGNSENWSLSLKIIVNFLLNSPLPMCLWWEPGQICFYNDAFCPILNEDGKHPFVSEMTVQETWPENWGTIKPFIDQVFTTGKAALSKNQLVPIYRKGAIEDISWTFSYSPVNDESYKVAGVHITCYERTNTNTFILDSKTSISKLENVVEKHIKDLKSLTYTLKKSEERYHLMVEEVEDYAILYLNRNGIIENWNKGAEKIKGYAASEIIGRSFSTFYTQQDRDNRLPERLLQQATNTGKAVQEGWRVRKDGSLFWASIVITAVHNEENEVIGFSKVTHDLTEKKIAEEKIKIYAHELEEKNRALEQANHNLKKSEERYHLMVEEVQEYAILYLNREGIIENWNQGAEKIKGYKAEEIIGKSFSNFYTKQDREDNLPQKLLQQAVTTGKAIQQGWRVRKDGSLFWASVVITAVHNEENEVIGFSKVTHDLTEKKKADDRIKANTQELEQKNKELERINTELQSFAYVASHDLQEPLRKIQTFSGRLLEKEPDHLSEVGKDYLERIRKSIVRMQALIEDLLAYSRTNIVERVFKKTDLSGLINEVKEELKESIAEKKATIEVETTCEVEVIQFQFKQLIGNLIGNSLKFSKPDIPPYIQIKSFLTDHKAVGSLPLLTQQKYCHVTIQDNGIGFEQEYTDRIFEVFQRLHGKSEYKGTGIGLAIVKKIVENHNGFITASSVVNHGATFDIFLPIDHH
ncbi:PAS domain-containing sensor histidine kinase [Emticicia sp. C21]|uniref:PAS domain-containing sensor histidine kinase n=1 Tax=Emticicia sp. C21 TaxID=2302915 RepID=UPI000E3499FA|nr:PAS domain-containing sensor histidine kinase [Emticicia sp. C21]RFS13326.1 PAS domain-containing sensor histidine kinase [Emticicia sp. C21]